MVDLPADTLAQAFGSFAPVSSSPFGSRTDELFALLRTGDPAISSSALDAFLALVRHPDFRPDALTLQTASDIDERVAAHRRGLARARSYRAGHRDIANMEEGRHIPKLRLPPEILLNIIDQINDSRPHFGASYANSSCKDVVESLKTISLTHRSLTLPAQRALSSRLIANTASHVAGLLHSPLLGENTRELVLRLNLTVSQADGHDEVQTPTSYVELITACIALVHRSPNARALKIICPAFVNTIIYGQLLRLLRGIKSAKLLRHFWWIAPDLSNHQARMHVEVLAKLLREFPFIDTVSFGKVSLGWCEDSGEDLDANSRPSIKTLSLISVTAPIDLSSRSISCLSWLLGNGSLTSLTIDLTSTSTSEAYTKAVLRVLADGAASSLESLRVRIGVGVCNLTDSTDVARLFENCTLLRYFQIWLGSESGVWNGGRAGAHREGSFTESMSQLAASFMHSLLSSATLSCRSLETIHLSFFQYAMGLDSNKADSWSFLDHVLTQSLSCTEDASLRRIMIDIPVTPHDAPKFTSVQQVCDQRDLTFDLREDSSLHFH